MRIPPALPLAWVTLTLAAPLPLAAQEEPQTPRESEEQCLARCDEESDSCMQEAEGLDRRMQVCDERYTECLRSCR